MKTYAVVNNISNICENVIVWDGRTEPIEITEPETIVDENGNVVETGNIIVVQSIPAWQPPANCYVICIDGTEAGIGWQHEDGNWIDVRIQSKPENAPSSEA